MTLFEYAHVDDWLFSVIFSKFSKIIPLLAHGMFEAICKDCKFEVR